MPTNVNVCINGFVLSTLIFDCGNDSGDQEGFLYGSITRNVRSEISDQSMNNTQEDILISICSSVPCGSFLSFYNNVGEINREDLEYNLGERVENIVGWYRFRRYSAMYPSAREQVAHRNLRAVFAPHSNMDDQFFVFGLLSSSNLPNFATHSFDYAFFTQRMDDTFRNLNLTILNLGDTRNSYRAGSLALPFMNSSSFNSVLSSSWNFNTFYETEDQIQQFHNRLRNKLECLQEELAASDAVNATLEDDIRRLSNEMQSLLATQERLSIAAARERELAESNEKGSEDTQESSDSNDEDDLNKPELPEMKEKECTNIRQEDAEKSDPCEGETEKMTHGTKRAALEPLESDKSSKRACTDKYFENEEIQNENISELLADCINEATAESSASKDDDTPLSNLVIDPDNGEVSAAQHEVTPKLEVESCLVEKERVPSPASNVEIEMSEVKSIGLLEDCNISTSEEHSNAKPPFIIYASKESVVSTSSDSSASVKTPQPIEENLSEEEHSVDAKEIESVQSSSSHNENGEEKEGYSEAVKQNKH